MYDPKLGYCPLWEDMKSKFPYVRYGDLKKLYKLIDRKSSDYDYVKSAFVRFFDVNGDYNFGIFVSESKYTSHYPRPYQKIKRQLEIKRDLQKQTVDNITIKSKKLTKQNAKLSLQFVFSENDMLSISDEYSPMTGQKRNGIDFFDDEGV